MKKWLSFLVVTVIITLLLVGGCTASGSFSPLPEDTSTEEKTSPKMTSTPDETTKSTTKNPKPVTQPSDSVLPTGTLTVLVTDAPSYNVTSVVVNFSEVWVHKSSNGGDDKGEWIPLEITGGMLDEGSFDLAELRDEGATAELAAANLVTGNYTQLRVVINEEIGVLVDFTENEGDPVIAKLPSGMLKFVRTFAVEADGSTEIILDFDLQKSVVFTGNFGKEPNPKKPDKPSVIVKPVVKLKVTSSGKECKLDGELTLENKDSDNDWAVIEDEIYGELRYNTEGENFCYEFQGFGLEDIEYSLIYYADTEDRFNDWGGDNPGALIASGTAVDGLLTLSGSVFLGMNLPHPDDANGYFYNYSESPDFYDNPTGAKIWLVPSESYNASETRVESWEPTRFLFETDLIHYIFDETAPAIPTNLTAVGGDGEISLEWDDNAEVDLEEYNVYRADDSGGPYIKIATVTDSEYVDTGLTNGEAYYYVVTAVDDSDNESGNSDEVSATPTP